MSTLRALVALALLAVPAASRAVTFVHLSSAGPDEPALGGRRLRLTPTAVHPYPAPDASGLAVALEDTTTDGRYWLYLVPPPGEQFAPGSYDGATGCGFGERPGVCLHSGGLFEQPVGGHIQVLEAAHDGAGKLIRLAADFSQHAAAAGTELVGSVRLNVGDDACGGAPDGTPCDDRDACSTESRCASGQCRAVASADCAGATGAPCRDAAVCDPVGGACQSATSWRDGTSCVADDPCTFVSVCSAGVCASDLPRTCYDGDACTYDTCDPSAGCTFPSIPGVCGRPGLPGVFLFVRRTPGGEPGDLFRSTPTEGTSVSLTSDAGVSVEAPARMSVRFAPPTGRALAPGAYDDVAPSLFPPERAAGQAALEIVSSGRSVSCGRLTSRFVVHEFATRARDGDRGHVAAFAADFEQRCEDDGTSVAGAVRFRAGDAACAGASDGAPCDDLDACTAGSTCQGGACRGHDPAVCEAIPGGCHESPLCDPTTGACVRPAALVEGASCADPASCIQGGTCQGDACVAAEPPCDDGNPCTADRCAAQGACAHDVTPGCWLVALNVKLTAHASGTLQGRSVECGPVRCQRTGRGALLLPDGGTYRALSGDLSCANGTTSRMPDEVGTVKATRSGKLRLRSTNRTQLRDAIRACIGRRVSLSGRQWVQISADGRQLTGFDRSRFTVFDRLPLVQTTVTRLTGRLGEFPPPATLPPGARECPQPLRLRCVAR